jgi:SAM-dependent methyltransferase
LSLTWVINLAMMMNVPCILSALSWLGNAQPMVVKQHIPWQLKIALKLVLSRIPFNYRLWKKARLFELGGMERPEYAVGVFRRHFDGAAFARRTGEFTALEIGPGDSLSSALIARAFGASHTYLVDVGPFASTDLASYCRLASHLRGLGLQPPDVENCSTFEQFKAACSAEYLTKGLASLRKIPTASVDFVWSHAVLPHVRRHDFLPTLLELRRIQRPDGVGSHHLGFGDILGGKMNDLRFSDRIWESSFMANSGFYTNRLRYEELLGLFRQAGFEPEIRDVTRWKTLPTPRRKMAQPFASLPEKDLQVSGLDVVLH